MWKKQLPSNRAGVIRNQPIRLPAYIACSQQLYSLPPRKRRRRLRDMGTPPLSARSETIKICI